MFDMAVLLALLALVAFVCAVGLFAAASFAAVFVVVLIFGAVWALVVLGIRRAMALLEGPGAKSWHSSL